MVAVDPLIGFINAESFKQAIGHMRLTTLTDIKEVGVKPI